MTITIGSLDLSALNNLYDETQYFWFESSAQPWGAGAHVTLYPQSEFTTSTHANYLKGQNILINTDGFSLRNGTLPMMTLDNDSLDFNVVNTTTGTYETTATFTATSARIGAITNGQSRTEISSTGIDFIRRDTTDVNLAHIGYDTGTAQSGTATAPYYTLGSRSADSTIGNYSMAEGRDAIASGYISHAEGTKTTASGNCSHAEGNYTTASGNDSHAEGNYTTASGNCSHAEGNYTTASGNRSHAEGWSTTASGNYSHAEGNDTSALGGNSHAEGIGCVAGTASSGGASHAQNFYTIAEGNYQTAIGKCNIADTTSALIIGNGSDDISRSNALTVDWNGNVNIASGAKYKINGTNLSASDVGALPLSGGTMTGQIKTSYRESIAMGSYGSSQSTVGGLVGEVRYSSGCMGSANITTAYTASGVTIPTGWYNFLWMPHRSGGVNGSASGDNCNYGQLLLFGMNNTNGRFIVRVSSSTIQEVAKIYTSVPSDTATAFYKVTTMAVSVAATSAHSSVSSANYTIPTASQVSGYNLVGIVGYTMATFRIVPFNYYVIDNSTINAGFVNTTATATTSAYNCTFRLLWAKATSA